MQSKSLASACLLSIVGACILATGCARQQQQQQRSQPSSPQAALEAPPPPPEANPTPDPTNVMSTASLPPPRTEEVNGAVERVFKDAVVIETGREPYFVVGNFNDDFSQDIAVVVKPAPGKLPDINDELANWILVAPVQPAAPAPKNSQLMKAHAETNRRRRAVVDEGDILLAVIHGFGADGWRNSQATQTYVLKDAAGEKLKTQGQKQIIKSHSKERLPRLRGDVMSQTIDGHSGFLYYDGAKYAWYDPQSYKPLPPARVVHGGAATPTQQ